MKQNPVTKNELKELLENYPTKTDLTDALKKFRDDIFNRMDDISGQLETIREEQILQYH